MTRLFLAVVGAGYVFLGAWCALFPDKTSRSVGFALAPGQGQSEFLTVYGGLEVALGLLFLWPLLRPDEAAFPLFACLVVHGCLVAFRSAGFFLYSGFPTTTFVLAGIEWAIFLVAAVLFWRRD